MPFKNKTNLRVLVSAALMSSLLACSESANDKPPVVEAQPVNKQENTQQHSSVASYQGKPVVYQVFTRLFGNQNTTNKPWGTLQENGVGKFNDFTDEALQGIKEFGVTHIWYTGVPHHATATDYSEYGISRDDPDVIKGRAGSPYAVKDYYNVNPDLAVSPSNRLDEFKALIERTHNNDMKVIIDIVPNHIARGYQSTSKPPGVEDFGAGDDTSVEYKKDNNFYYVVGESFKVPVAENGYQPLGGDSHPLLDGRFDEVPAKWTGNGARAAQPNIHDWYETVKVNYGVRPDGTYDFVRLPEAYRNKGYREHLAFWADKQIPDSWNKFRDIVLYWTEMGVDGFRYDMAEMVPVEFWSYLNASIKQKNPDAFLLAEVYNPKIYRDYIELGKMDYLYDKVDYYDTLKLVMQGKSGASAMDEVIEKVADIDRHMLHFLENHDEQRIASKDFAGEAKMGKPAMVVSTLTGKAPTMLYFAQALGEAGDGDAGFGDPTRTTIFDYWGIPSLQRWVNGGKFDGGRLTDEEKTLRQFYTRLLSFSNQTTAVHGEFYSLQSANLAKTDSSVAGDYDDRVYAFSRWHESSRLVAVASFADSGNYQFALEIPAELIQKWQLENGSYQIQEVLQPKNNRYTLTVENGIGHINIELAPLQSKVFVF